MSPSLPLERTIGGGLAPKSLVERDEDPLAGAGSSGRPARELVPPGACRVSETDAEVAVRLGATLRNHDLVTPPALASTCANAVTVWARSDGKAVGAVARVDDLVGGR
jgi:hypothetical protein